MAHGAALRFDQVSRVRIVGEGRLKDEIVKQMAHIREWGGKFVVMIPEVKIIP